MSTIPLGLYLWKRIREVGIETVFGVPGDFNLNFLDFIYDVPDLKFVGGSNELNASYAADGYARVKEAPACLVTTHGVGELSAINGIAGAACEKVPIIHIVGQTPKFAQDNHLMIHHSIGDRPDHQLYNHISKHIRCAAAELWEPEKAPQQIDEAIRQCFVQRLPVYIYFPIDMTAAQIPAQALEKKIDTSFPVNKENEQKAIQDIKEALRKAKNPSILVDAITRAIAVPEARRFVENFQLPTYCTPMTKGLIDEDAPFFVGIYNGSVGRAGVAEAIQSSDVLLFVGDLNADTNTGAFTRNLKNVSKIYINDDHVKVGETVYRDVYMKPLLEKLSGSEHAKDIPRIEKPKLEPLPEANGENSKEGKITQSYIWRRFGRFLQPGDVVLADTGTPVYGIPEADFPKNVKYLVQSYYMSIGWSGPAAVGADLALQELHKNDSNRPRGRTILVIGDGSLQLTIQDIGTSVTAGSKPIIFLINNNGYTIERAIHGAEFSYNNINIHRYEHLLKLYNHPNADTSFHSAKSVKDFEEVLEKEHFKNPKDLQLFEVHMEERDIPWRLAKLLINRDQSMEQYFKDHHFTISH